MRGGGCCCVATNINRQKKKGGLGGVHWQEGGRWVPKLEKIQGGQFLNYLRRESGRRGGLKGGGGELFFVAGVGLMDPSNSHTSPFPLGLMFVSVHSSPVGAEGKGRRL